LPWLLCSRALICESCAEQRAARASHLTRRLPMLERVSTQHDTGEGSPAASDAVTLLAEKASAGVTSGPGTRLSTDDDTNRKNMALLIQLRWTAVVGQIGTIAFVDLWLGIALPLAPMAGLIAALVVLNVASLIWVRHRAEINNRELLVALMLDVAALTGQLYLSGGASNPFNSLYLLPVQLRAILLDARSTSSLVSLSC